MQCNPYKTARMMQRSKRFRGMRSTPIAIIAPLCLLSLLLATGSEAFVQPLVRAGRFTSTVKESAPAPRVESAVDGVLDLFNQKSVVAVADAHGLAQEEAFYSALVRDPRFAKEVGNVVVEFGGSGAQSIIDRYVNGQDVSVTELRHVWTDVVGWLPGPFSLGYVNFFANVRAVNQKLPASQRITVWLGDPKIDWSQIHSFQDIEPHLSQRDESMFRIVRDEILAKRKKALLIVGGAHLFGSGSDSLPAKINREHPNSMALVAPFIGYIEPSCNARFVAYTKGWPVPAVVGPIEGTSLMSELELAGCNYIPKTEIQRIEKMAATPPPPGVKPPPGMSAPPSPASLISAETNMFSGANANAILYLGPPDELLEAPADPSIYLDPDYFKEMNRRAQCCMPRPYSLDWDQLVRQNSVIPRKFQAR
jgi:hypothetical protein